MMAGAIAKTSGVGLMKIQIYRFGTAMLRMTQNALKTATVHKAYFSVFLILSPRFAPRFVEMMGCADCPTL